MLASRRPGRRRSSRCASARWSSTSPSSGRRPGSYLERVCDALPGPRRRRLHRAARRSPSASAGCASGADDWLTKPCHPEELIARVEAVVRRRRRTERARRDAARSSAGEVEIRADRFQAFVGGAVVDLTRREFELIELLAGAEGRVLEREEIYQRVWGYAMARGDRSVDVFVRKLRQKLEKASPEWRYIHTHFGVGYRFAAEPVEGSEPARRERLAADGRARRRPGARRRCAGRRGRRPAGPELLALPRDGTLGREPTAAQRPRSSWRSPPRSRSCPAAGRRRRSSRRCWASAIGVIFVLLGGALLPREPRGDLRPGRPPPRAALRRAVGAVVVALAGRAALLDTGVGTLVFFVLLLGAAAAVWRRLAAPPLVRVLSRGRPGGARAPSRRSCGADS